MSEDCGCCTTAVGAVSALALNRPGLSAVAYRIGTFATFRKAILDELSRTPELAKLSARLSDDYTISVIELWSAVADVLTFYQERTANEAYLRTATLRDSVLRLVRLIDYQLGPGAAATAELTFTLDTHAKALIPAGTRVQSIAGEGEKPQKFETLAPVSADARLNRLRIFPPPISDAPTGSGSARAIAAPDPAALLAVAALARGDHVILYAPMEVEVLTVKDVSAQDDMLVVSWAVPIKGSAFLDAYDAASADARAYKLGRSFRLFGFNAPETAVVARLRTTGDPTTTYLTTASTDFTLHNGASITRISLDARYPGLKAGSTILAVGGAAALPFEISAVSEAHVSRSTTSPATTVQSGVVTRLDLTPLGGAITGLPNDVRDVAIHELIGPPLRFWPFAYPDRVAPRDVVIPGRRAGWSSIETGRVIEKGVAKPGTLIEPDDFGHGRRVLLTDGAEPIGATVAVASIFGAGVSFAPTDSDLSTIRKLGFAPDQATSVTVVASVPLVAPISFPNVMRELTVTIGSLPIQKMTLASAGGSLNDVAAALQAAIRAALPGAPTFAHAMVWAVDGAIVIAPGVPGDRVAFGPSANDPATVVALGLDAGRARFLDGVVSASITLFPELTPYQQFGLQTGTALHETDGTFAFALGPNRDVIAIKKANTGTNSTEVHVLSAASTYQTFSLQTGTVLHETDASFAFALAPNRDLVAIKKWGTGTNSTEVHVLSAASNYQQFSLQTGTALPETDASFAFALAPNRDLIAIKKHGTGSNSTEVYLLSAADNYQHLSLHTGTALAETDDMFVFALASNGDLIVIKKSGTGTNSTEVHVLPSVPFSGSASVTIGADAPLDRLVAVPIWSAPTLASAIAQSLPAITRVTADDRILVLPLIPARERRAFIRLALAPDATGALAADTAVLLGNVAPASHGETIRSEILGDGDAAQAFQRFALKKKPITYVPSATPGGIASSLQVLVNGVRWGEAKSLYPASEHDQVYVTRIADDGTMTVQFGDGTTGERPATGRQNIVARYRQGIGVAGRVGATKLTTLLDRPTGVKSVTNLRAADGGADPETMDRARSAAPGTVRTFGRAISLCDFNDTALMAGEVAKASATWAWNGECRSIHLTVAAQGGASFSPDGLKRIAATLATERDPNHKLLVDNYLPVAVRVEASLLVEDRYVASDVVAAARAALLGALSFDRRGFAEPVYLSDIFAILQNVSGVAAVDVDVLDLKSRDAPFRAAHGVDDALGQPQSRLLMLPARPVGSLGAVLAAELAVVEVPAQDVVLRSSGGLSV